MAGTARTLAAPPGAAEEPRLLPAREVDLRRAVRVGLLGGVAVAFVSAIGMVESFAARRVIDTMTFGYLLFLLIPAVTGYLAGSPPPQIEGFAAPRKGPRNALGGLIGGALAGLVLAAFVAIFDTFDIRSVFVNVSPQLLDLLKFGQGLGAGIGLIVLSFTALGGLGGALHLVGKRWRRPLFASLVWLLTFGLLEDLIGQIFRGIKAPSIDDALYTAAGGLSITSAVVVTALTFALYAVLGRREGEARSRARQGFARLPSKTRRQAAIVGLIVVLAILGALPQILGPFLSEVLDQAGIFLLMALGLNIVIGFAGLLDLGYVAFFAVGAYATAVLTSPASPEVSPELTFWASIPFVVLAAAVAGILVGTPVLRMRGDYLAIVTLGFGEIARLLFLSDATKGTFGGAQGILTIPDISFFGIVIRGPQAFFYAILGFALVAAYMSYALQDSRIGRAWMAMREDENVAETMGVNIVRAKLGAFIIGAILASFGGALFAVKIGSVFPHSFNIVVSITVVVVIIVGGLGSMPGVALGALVLVGLPQLLREFEEFQFLLYGLLLIFMMLKRPEGFIPSRRRAAELHEKEREQDSWLRLEQERQEEEEVAPPVVEAD